MTKNKILKKRVKSDVPKFYLQAIFQQTFTQPPKSFSDPIDANLHISNTEGGIGIIFLSNIPPEHSMKIIPVR
ncbi:MAG: hypothetical protein ACI8PD_000614 [Nitrospinales bacterium]|jgi:hypothetical protein